MRLSAEDKKKFREYEKNREERAAHLDNFAPQVPSPPSWSGPEEYERAYKALAKVEKKIDLENPDHEAKLKIALYALKASKSPNSWADLNVAEQVAVLNFYKKTALGYEAKQENWEKFSNVMNIAAGIAGYSGNPYVWGGSALWYTFQSAVNANIKEMKLTPEHINALGDQLFANHKMLRWIENMPMTDKAQQQLMLRIKKEEDIRFKKSGSENKAKTTGLKEELDRLAAFAQANHLDLQILGEEIKKQLDDNLKRLQEAEKERNFQIKIHNVKEVFADIINIGNAIHHPKLAVVGYVGQNMTRMGESLWALRGQIPILQGLFSEKGIFNTALSGISVIQPYLAFATSIMQISMALFGRKQKDPMAGLMMQRFQEILQSVEQLRNEMHKRFNRIDAKLDQLFLAIDRVNFELKGLIEFYSDQILNNIDHVYRALEADIKLTEDYLGDLITQNALYPFKRLIHTLEECQKTPKKDVRKLKEAYRELENLWLIGELCNENYNSKKRFTSMRGNKRLLAMGRPQPIGNMLGYLAEFATEQLDITLRKKTQELPNVSLWIQGVRVSLMAHRYAHDQYGEPLEHDANIETLTTIAKNTLAFLDELIQQRHLIFKAIFSQYKEAAIGVAQQITHQITDQLKSNKYSLKECIELKLVDLSQIAGGGMIIANLNNFAVANLEIPVSALLALKLGLASLSSTLTVARPTPAKEQGVPSHIRKHSKRIYTSLGAQSTLCIKIGELSLFSIQFNKESKDTPDVYPKDQDDAYYRRNSKWAEEENKQTDLQVLGISTFSGAKPLGSSLDSSYHKKIAEKILLYRNLPAKTSNAQTELDEILGPSLSTACSEIYSNACKNAQPNNASFEDKLDVMKVMNAATDVYGRLMGLPEKFVQSCQYIMQTDLGKILSNPSFISNLPIQLNELEEELLQHQGPFQSEIYTKIQGSFSALHQYQVTILLSDRYGKNLQQILQNFQSVKYIEDVLQRIQEMNGNSQIESFFEETGIKYLLNNCHTSQQNLEQSIVTLTTIHQSMLEFGLLLPSPREKLAKLPSANNTTQPSHTPSLRRGIPSSNASLVDKTLFDIIKSHPNPYADTLTRLCSLEIEKAIALVHCTDPEGRTPLHYAAGLDDIELMKLLLTYDADVTKIDKQGKKAIDLLPENAHKAKALLLSREKWQSNEIDLGFSSNRVAGLIENVPENVLTYPNIQSAILLFGITGAGKSTLANFMQGTDYKKIDSEFLETWLEPCDGTKPEISKSSRKTVSETLYPVFVPCGAETFVDMPGFEDTRGREAQICAGICTQLVAAKAQHVKAVIMVVKHPEIIDNRKLKIRDTFIHVGRMMRNKRLSNFLLVVTEANTDLSKKTDGENNYEKGVFQILSKWRSHGETNEDARYILENLSQEKIVVVEAHYPKARQRLKERLQKLQSCPSHQFNFGTYQNHTESFKRFLGKMKDHREQHAKQINKCISSLCVSWKNNLPALQSFTLSALQEWYSHPLFERIKENEFQIQQNTEMLKHLSHDLMEQLNKQMGTVKLDVVNNTEEVHKRIVRIMDESMVNADLFTRLDSIAQLLKLETFRPQKKSENQQPHTENKENYKSSQYANSSARRPSFFTDEQHANPRSVKIEGKFFNVHEVPRDGNCGYTALFGMTRNFAYELLKENITQIQSLLIPVIKEELLKEKFINYLTERCIFVEISYLFEVFQTQIKQGLNVDVIKSQLFAYADKLKIVNAYLDYDVKDKQIDEGWSHPCVLQALARIRKVNLTIWVKKDNQIVSHKDYHSYTFTDATDSKHLLFLNGHHFELLIEMPQYNQGEKFQKSTPANNFS